LLPSGPGGVYSVSLREDRHDHHYVSAVLAKGQLLSLNKFNKTSQDDIILIKKQNEPNIRLCGIKIPMIKPKSKRPDLERVQYLCQIIGTILILLIKISILEKAVTQPGDAEPAEKKHLDSSMTYHG
jgi:hypothetical protein